MEENSRSTLTPVMTGEPSIQHGEHFIRKSNEFIEGIKFSRTAYELKLMNAALLPEFITEVQIEGGSFFRSIIPEDQLRKWTNDQSSKRAFRTRISRVSKHLMETSTVLITNRKTGEFIRYNVIKTMGLQNGQGLAIDFHELATPHMMQYLETNYTKLSLEIMTTFVSHHSLRVYELLRKDAYKLFLAKSKGGTDTVMLTYAIDELRCLLGLVDFKEDDFSAEIKRGEWGEIVRRVSRKHQQHYDYRDFKRHVLNVAQAELQDKSDLLFEYQEVTANSRTVIAIKFMISRNKHIIDTLQRCGNGEEFDSMMQEVREEMLLEQLPEMADVQGLETTGVVPQQNVQSASNRQIAYGSASAQADGELTRQYAEAMAYLVTNIPGINASDFTLDYFMQLMRSADNDLQRIKEQIFISTRQKEIHNYFGWLKKAVENRYSQSNEPAMLGDVTTAKRVQSLKETLMEETADSIEPVYDNDQVHTEDRARAEWERIKLENPQIVHDMCENYYHMSCEEMEAQYTHIDLWRAYMSYTRSEMYRLRKFGYV